MTTAVGATASPGAAASSTEVRPPEERHDHRQSAEQRNHDARQSPPGKTTAAVAAALHTGYRQIDTAGSIRNVRSGLCLDANGAGTANGTPLVLWTCNGQANQKWTRA